MEPHDANGQGKMSTAERRAFQQLCQAGGRMLVVALDQRNAMRALLANSEKARGEISDFQLGEVKADIIRFLGNYAPAILLDPGSALPRVVDEGILARDVALLVGMDASGWKTDGDPGLRRSYLIPGMNARRVRELGGTAAKLLVYMRPDREGVDAHAADLIRRVSHACSSQDLLLVVEILVYRLPEEAEEAYESSRPSLILGAARIAIESGAKVLKLQFPGSAEACRSLTEVAAGIPWALLSEGADHPSFLQRLRVAMAGGAAGAIVGRSLWKDCVSLDSGVRKDRLQRLALPRLREVEALLNTVEGQPAQYTAHRGT